MKLVLALLLFTFAVWFPPSAAAVISPICDLGNLSIQTEFGCISSQPVKVVEKFFTLGIGIAGGIAFLLILYGAFQIMTSAGNPENLNTGKETVVGAIAGLLMIILSIFLLKIIGVDILCVPGLGRC